MQLRETAGILIQGDIRPTHGIRIAFEDHTGVIARHISVIAMANVSLKVIPNVHAHHAVNPGGPG
jgi:hypothetical protein